MENIWPRGLINFSFTETELEDWKIDPTRPCSEPQMIPQDDLTQSCSEPKMVDIYTTPINEPGTVEDDLTRPCSGPQMVDNCTIEQGSVEEDIS